MLWLVDLDHDWQHFPGLCFQQIAKKDVREQIMLHELCILTPNRYIYQSSLDLIHSMKKITYDKTTTTIASVSKLKLNKKEKRWY